MKTAPRKRQLTILAVGLIVAILLTMTFVLTRPGPARIESTASGGKTSSSPPAGPSGALEGTVIEAGGGPVADATVTLSCEGQRTTVTTTHDGSYAFAHIPVPADTNACTLQVVAAGFLPCPFDPSRPFRVSLRAGETREPKGPALYRAGSIRGQIVGPEGPLDGATVRLTVRESPALAAVPLELATTTSDEAGGFTFEDLPPGRFVLEATTAAGLSGHLDPGWLEAGRRVDDLTFELFWHGRIEGHVLNPKGERVAGYPVSLQGAQTLRGRTDARGAFVFEALPPGDYTVHAFSARHPRLAFKAVSLAANAKSPVTLRVEPRWRVEGRVVTPTGEPVARAHVYAEPTGAHAPAGTSASASATAQAVTDQGGRFALDLATPTRVSLTGRAAEWAPSAPIELDPTLGRGAPRLVLRAGTRLRGVAVDRGDGQPVVAAQVRLLDETGARTVARATTTATGSFETTPVAPGRYLVELRSRLHVPARRECLLSGLEGREDLGLIELQRGARLHGRVVAKGSDRGLGGVRVQARATDDTERVGDITPSNGTFDLGPLGPGEHTLTFTGPHVQGETRALDIPELPTELPSMLAELGPSETGEAETPLAEAGPGLRLVRRPNGLYIAAVIPGSSADRSGVATGDRLVAVEGSPVDGLPLRTVYTRLHGAAGTVAQVQLKTSTDDRMRELSLRRR